jgi:hypothetical protein
MASAASPKSARHHASVSEVRIYLDLDHTLAPGTTIARVRLAFPVTPSLA